MNQTYFPYFSEQKIKKIFKNCKQTGYKILIYHCGGVKRRVMNMVFALAKGLKG